MHSQIAPIWNITTYKHLALGCCVPLCVECLWISYITPQAWYACNFIAEQKKTIIFLRGIKIWGSMAFEATLKKLELSVYCCYPPLLFALMSFLAMPKNSLAVLSPSLKYVSTICVSDCFCIVTFYFIWHNLLLALFPKCWNQQICHSHRVFKLLLCTFSSKLQTFPMVKSKTP